jgi:hypothetical protein
MTSIVDPETDKILNTYNQYERLTSDRYIAAQLTVAHFLDHVVCVMKENTQYPPKVVKINSSP